MRIAVFILMGVLISMAGFFYVFYDSYGKLAKQFSKINTLEREVATQSTREIATTRSPISLFDIKLEMDKTKITESEELTARVIFTSFGTTPTPVDMTFTITNSQKENIHQETDAITVETESVFRKQFKDFKLEPGIYTLILKTVYGNAIKDEFRQEFEVKKKKFLWIF